MKVSKALKIWLDYHLVNSKKKYTSFLFCGNGQILQGVWRPAAQRIKS
jgi:hypothetical protein